MGAVDAMGLLQWPAFAITVAAAWLVGSEHPGQRKAGFWCHMVANALWVVWGFHTSAWALVALQIFLVAMNIRGAAQNRRAEHDPQN